MGNRDHYYVMPKSTFTFFETLYSATFIVTARFGFHE